MKKQCFTKKVIAVVLALAMAATGMFCLGLITVSAEETITTNGNGGKSDVGGWYTTYNTSAFWGANGRFSNPSLPQVGFKALRADGTYGIPNSGSATQIDFQIKKMAEAGIDFILFDLTNGGLSSEIDYGNDTGLAFIVNNAKLTCERLSNWNDKHAWKIRYAVAVGIYDALRKRYTGSLSGQPYTHEVDGVTAATIGLAAELQAQAVYEQFISNETYGDDYYTVNNKPLLVLHDTQGRSGSEKLAKYITNGGDATYASGFTVRDSVSQAEAGDYGWYTYGSVADNNNCGAVADDEVMLVSPGHWNHSQNTPRAPRENGGHYQQNWEAAIAQKPRIVMISSINDYMEDGAVWPTDTSDCVVEEHWLTNEEEDPYKYWNMTTSYIQQLHTANSDDILNSKQRVSESLVVGRDTVSGNPDMTDGNSLYLTNGYAAVNMSGGYANWQFNFDSLTTVNQVKIYLSNQETSKRPRDFAVDVKLANGTWKRVAERHNVTFTNDVDQFLTYDDNKQLMVHIPFNFASEDCVAVRITACGNRNPNCTNWLLKEIEVFNNENLTELNYTGTTPDENPLYNIPVPKSDNLALGKTVTTNGYVASGASILTDGKTNSAAVMFYNTSGGTATNTKNIYLNLPLSDVCYINKVDLCVGLEYGSGKWKRDSHDYAVDILTEDDIYARVAEVHNYDFGTAPASGTGMSYKTIHFNFEGIAAKEVRITANRTQVTNYASGETGGPVFSPAEISIWYDPDATPLTGIQTATVANTEIDGYKSANFALGGTVTTNAKTAKNGSTVLSASKRALLTDGSANTINDILAYFSVNHENPEAIYFDIELDKERIINTVDLTAFFEKSSETASGIKRDIRDVAIDAITADGNYVRVAERHDIPNSEYPTSSTSKKFNFTFEDIAAVGVRITLNKANEGYNKLGYTAIASLTEVAVYNTELLSSYTGIASPSSNAAAIPQYCSINFASGLSVTTSNTNSSFATSYPASRATDGRNTRDSDCVIINFMSSGLAWVNIDLGETKEFNKVVLSLSKYEPANVPQDMAVEALTENGWVRVAEKHDITYGVTAGDGTLAPASQKLYFTFESVEASAFKLIVSRARNSTNNFRFVELECYNDPNVAEYDTVVKSDVDGDLMVSAQDMVFLCQALLSKNTTVNMDVNGDGFVDIKDLARIKKYLAGQVA